MADAVQRGQRFTAERPCPICGGYDKMPRGKGVRCYGYIGTDGKFAHCTREDLAAGIAQEQGGTFPHRLEGECRCGSTHGEASLHDLEEARARRDRDGDRVVGEITYDYEGGLRVIRRELANGEKTFVQFHKNGAGYVPGRGDAPLTLYRAAELRTAPLEAFVFLVEGEKCVDNLRMHELVATTTPGGAKQWKGAADQAAEILRDRHVVILPDNDDPGRGYAAAARETLVTVAASLRVLELPGLEKSEDVVDWIRRGGEAEELVRLAETKPDIARRPPGPVRIAKVVDEIIAEAALPIVPTGFQGLDFQLGGGLRARMMHVIVAGSGKGKTSLAVQIAASHAERSPVLYYSGELTRAQLAARLIGQRTGHAWREVLRGHVAREDMLRVLSPLEFDVLRGCDEPIATITSAADEMLARRRGVPLIVIDYAQIVADLSTAKDPRLALMLAVRSLVALVETRDIVLLVLSQGSRASASRMRQGESTTEDYVDSGADSSDIEKFASTLIALVYASGDGVASHEVTAMIAKQRLGGPCKAGLKFHGPSGRWEDLGHAPVSAAAKKREERVKTVIELVQRHPKHFTKTELRQRAGGDTGPTSKLIDDLVLDGKLVVVTTVRRNAAGIAKAIAVIDLPAKPQEQP